MKLSQLKRIKSNGGYTLCAGRDHFLYTSHKSGIAPIMDMLKKDGNFFHDCVICDTIIGKAAAMMLVSSHVSYIHAQVMSEAAIRYLSKQNVAYTYDSSCPYIVNRTQTGMCPMEESVKDIDDEEIAYFALSQTMERLRAQKEVK